MQLVTHIDSTSERSRSVSLAPSDSLSQASSRASSSALPPISPFHQPASRPSQYPFEVLWCLDDCKHDPDVKISPGNESRPSMQSALRNADGTLISDGVWDAIRLSSRQIAQSLLNIDTSAQNEARSRTKQFFKSFFSAEWVQAITQLEQLQPLLRFCAAHWKADHVLGATLASITHTSRPSSKRHIQHDEVPTSKKPRSDHITVSAIRTMHKRNGHGQTPGVLGAAAFSRKPDRSSSSAGTTSTTTSLDPSQPQAVDPSCGNLISKYFGYYMQS